MTASEAGLDFEFLRYVGVTPESQKAIQRFYLPFFQGCRTVTDLGCGDGDFLEVLAEEGIRGIGVDRDALCCEAARGRGLNVVCQDVFAYLQELPEASLDGIFSAHLVEHLTYGKVLELFRLSHRALRDGGVIVMTTPNVRGLFAHLEMFYLHFGHVTFYHPRLLCFLLQHVGFQGTASGENPNTPGMFLMANAGGTVGAAASAQPEDWLFKIDYAYAWPFPPKGLVGKAIVNVRKVVARLVVRPYLDQLVHQLNTTFYRLDRPFECYARATKGERK